MYSKNYLDIRDCLSQCQLAFLGHSTLLLTLTATGLPPLACVMVLPAFLGWEEVCSLKRWTIREWMAKNLWVAGSKNVWPPRAHANHISLGRSCYQTMQLLTSHVNLDQCTPDGLNTWAHSTMFQAVCKATCLPKKVGDCIRSASEWTPSLHYPKPKGPDHSKIRILFQPKNEANLPTQPPNIYRVYPVYNTVITVVASWEKFGFISRYPHSWFR